MKSRAAIGGLFLVAVTVGSIALHRLDGPQAQRIEGPDQTYESSAFFDDADERWFPTMREAVLDRAAQDGITGSELYIDHIPDGFGPPDVARRPAVSDGRTICVMYPAVWSSTRGWLIRSGPVMGCDPFARNGEPRHPDGTVQELP